MNSDRLCRVLFPSEKILQRDAEFTFASSGFSYGRLATLDRNLCDSSKILRNSKQHDQEADSGARLGCKPAVRPLAK